MYGPTSLIEAVLTTSFGTSGSSQGAASGAETTGTNGGGAGAPTNGGSSILCETAGAPGSSYEFILFLIIFIFIILYT